MSRMTRAFVRAAHFGYRFMLGGDHVKPPKDERPCLVCKKPHRNNNCFCSAECCRAYRARQRDAN
jgi:hypothetical protein